MGLHFGGKGKQLAPLGCFALFGGVFAAVGIGMTIALVLKLAAWTSIQSWEPVQARVLSARLVEHPGDDSTTYSVQVQYRYTVKGVEYTGTRVGVHKGPDNIGSFQRRVAEELAEYADSGKPFTAYVNPDAPGEAVLYRNLRPELLLFYAAFGLVFGGFGIGLLAAAWVSRKRAARKNRLMQAYPGEPWQWNEEWRAGILKSSNKSRMLLSGGFALAWNAISVPVAVAVFLSVDLEKEPAALVVSAFPLVGVGLALWAARTFIQWRKFGETTLQLAAIPVRRGGSLDGVLRLPARVFPSKGFQLRLDCVELVTTGSGKNRSTSERILWQDTRHIGPEAVLRDAMQSAVPVSFRVPVDQPETQADGVRLFWRLVVSADMPGVDFYADFKLPVFGTAVAPAAHPDAALAEYAVPADSGSASAGAHMQFSVPVEISDTAVRVHFPRARHLGVALGLSAFFVVWTGSIVLMVIMDAPLLFPIVFGLVDLLIALFLVELLFAERHAEAGPGELVLSGGLFGFGAPKRFSAGEVRVIQAAGSMQAGSKVYYSLRAETSDGRKHTVGSRLNNRQEATAIANALQEVLFR